jgi:Arc/MetJ family transcription regulator
MKRMNFIVDEKLLAEAKRLLGADTQSETVNKSLEQMIKVLKIRGLFEAIGTGAWSGDLASMREDKPKRKRKRAG